MRILNIICTLDPTHGGPADGAIKLADIWHANNHRVDFVTLDHPSAVHLVGITHSVFALGELGKDPKAGGQLPLWRRFGYSPKIIPWLKSHSTQYDAVIVHSLWNYSTVAARWALAESNVPYFVFPHGCLDPWFRVTYPKKDIAKRLLWRIHEGPLLNKATSVLFTTQEELLLAAGTFAPWSVTSSVVGFGTADIAGDAQNQTSKFRRSVPYLGERPYLLYLSRLHPKKGGDLLIKAFMKLAIRHPDVDLVMAGPDETGWGSLLQSQLKASGLNHRVHWTGMISGDVKWGAFRDCDAFVLPSHSENFGIAVAEALACSKPVLITDKVNLWREVTASGAGFVEPDTQSGIEQLLSRYFAISAREKDAMGVRARICFEENFRMEAAARNIIDVITGGNVAQT